MTEHEWSPASGLEWADWKALRTWQAERERGLVHTPAYDAMMAGLERIAAYRARTIRQQGDDENDERAATGT